jgi:predicted phosphodiesterase
MRFAVLSDLHLQFENPVCRLDEYYATECKKLEWVRNTIGWDTSLLIAGDIFDTGKPRNLLKMHGDVCRVLNGCKTIYGNHDLSFHADSYLQETAYAALDRAIHCHMDTVTDFGDYEIHPFNFGHEIQHETPVYGKPMIAMSHQFVYREKLPFDKGSQALYLLTEFPEYAMIITGDNHQHIVETYDGRLLLNNGSVMRMTSAQIGYQPVVTVIDVDKIVEIPIPVDLDAVTDRHIVYDNDKTLSRDTMLAYMELVRNADNETYDFTSNLLHRLQEMPDSVTKNVLFELYEELKEDV